VSDTFVRSAKAAEPEAHGTAIAGIVAARQQIRGLAPDARVLPLRAFAGGGGRKPEATACR
jgi:subtilisin family serine protease